MKKGQLSRRTFLHAVTATGVACLGLPTLEAMVNTSGTAYADGTPLPVRFGIWFWGNGVQKDTWLPQGVGSDWSVPTGWPLEVLIERDVKKHVTVVTGTHIPGNQGSPAPHFFVQGPLLTGHVWYMGGSKPAAARLVDSTPDQLVADHYGAAPPIVAVVNDRPFELAGPIGKYLSWRRVEGEPFGPTSAQPFPAMNSPAAIFDAIFGATIQSDVDLRAKTSVLDAVGEQLKSLRNQVGASDRARLDAHFTALRQVEALLQSDVKLCRPKPTGLSGLDPNDASDQGMRARHDAMIRVIALAFSCNARHAFNLSFTCAGDETPMPVQVNFPGESAHGLSHIAQANPWSPDYAPAQEDVRRVTRYQIDRFADLIDYLAKYEDFDGSPLLDSCAILGTTELWDGNFHSYEQQPILVAGTARGRLKKGLHVAASGSSCEVTLSLLRAAIGPSISEFGAAEEGLRVTDGLASIEA
jgi:hypothetical protein